MHNFSKSKLIAYRQCPKRLWLEIHHPELRQDSAQTTMSYQVGHTVGEIAQRLYDPAGTGALIDAQTEGFDAAFTRTAALLNSDRPIFEAGFCAAGALAFADVMLPIKHNGQNAWRMIEVKSSAGIKDYHRDDAAIQAFVARSAGTRLASVALAHIDSQWTYPGDGDYRGLLVEEDLSEEVFGRGEEVKTWIAAAQDVASQPNCPACRTGKKCSHPYECGFLAHCQSQEPGAEFPVSWLPQVRAKALIQKIEEDDIRDLRDIPDELLNPGQLRVKSHTLNGETFFDAAGAASDLASHKPPAYFIDFETIKFAVPIWKGTRPFQQIPFQFSLHRLTRTGKLEHHSYLDLSGNDPSLAFAEALVSACGKKGPVFVFNAGFETARIKELAERFPKLREDLLAINARVVDLLPIARARYYHPSQQGSWSIKKVLPAIAPDLRYDHLDGVQDGGMAMDAYLEAIAPTTGAERKNQIQQQLFVYCQMDTFAMVRLWQFFTGHHEI